MMTHLMYAGIAAAFFLGGCATRPAVTIAAPFDEAATAAQMQEGTNSIKGSALIRQMGGGVVTCAGFQVAIFPATPFSKARMTAIYGSLNGGLAPVYQAMPVFNPDPPTYRNYMKQTRCDAQGFFRFDNLSDGEYYVGTSINWKINYVDQGGAISELVTVKGGQTKEIVLAR